MRTLAVVIVLLLVGIAVLGFYRGWFRVSTENADHKPSATFTVDRDKIQEDEHRATDKVHSFGQGAKENTGQRTQEVK